MKIIRFKYIGSGAFYKCESFKEIKIPSSVEYIEDIIFQECKNLENITINAKCKIPQNIFEYCKNIKNIAMTKQSYDLSSMFVAMYKDKIKAPKSIDELINVYIDEGKSFHEISKIYKEIDK